jgi:hypothetical protein
MHADSDQGPEVLLPSGILDRLRDHYHADVMLAGAVNGITRHFVGAIPLATFMGDLYDADKMAPIDRQRCLIALMARDAHPLTLGVHVYWGLCEGLSLREVYQTLLLSAGYQGAHHYTTSTRVLEQHVLPLLRALADGPPDRAETGNVIRELAHRFG